MGALYGSEMRDDERRLKRTSTSVSSLTTASSLRSVDVSTSCDKVKRQTILALVIPGITVVTLGGIILPVSFLIGVALFSFGTILMLPLPLLIWRMKGGPTAAPFQADVADSTPLPAPSVTPKDALYGRLRPNGMVEESESPSSYVNFGFESYQAGGAKPDPVKTIFDPATMWLDQREIISPIPIKPDPRTVCCPQCQSAAAMQSANNYIVTSTNTGGYGRPPPPLYSAVVRESPLI